MNRLRLHGFTLVEIIIAIGIIAILATIGFVSYGSYQQRATDTAVQTDLRDMSDQFEIFRTKSTTDVYPAGKDDLETLTMNVTNSAYKTSILANIFACVSSDKKSYAIVAQSKSEAIYMAVQGGKITPFSQPASSFTYSNTCSSLGLGLASVGWYSGSSATPGPWRAWVGGA